MPRRSSQADCCALPSMRGFTLIEMLVVVAIISLLIAILMPTLRGTRESAEQNVCTNNLHQIHTAVSAYSVGNQRRFPYDTVSSNGPWMWDLTRTAGNELINSAGGKVDIFYCPSNSKQNALAYWNYSTHYRVLGYFVMFKRHSGPLANYTLTGGKKFVRGFTNHYDHATQEVASDSILSSNGDFTNIQGGLPHVSSHLDKSTNKPKGGNVLFLDGHVEWREFAKMQIRYQSPQHWY